MRQLAAAQAAVSDLDARIAKLQAEMGTELTSQLSGAEAKELESLAPALQAAQVGSSAVLSHFITQHVPCSVFLHSHIIKRM